MFQFLHKAVLDINSRFVYNGNVRKIGGICMLTIQNLTKTYAGGKNCCGSSELYT